MGDSPNSEIQQYDVSLKRQRQQPKRNEVVLSANVVISSLETMFITTMDGGSAKRAEKYTKRTIVKGGINKCQ